MGNDPYDKEENSEAWTAWQCLMRTRANIFLTGRAGTGKTTFLHRLQSQTKRRIVVVAPTGVAAINAGGVTIHSFFQLSPGISLPDQPLDNKFRIADAKRKLMRTMDLLVIDEISMVRADLLDDIDKRLREVRRSILPFGGVQLLLIGDLQQLSPVATPQDMEILRAAYETPFFFSSQALQAAKIYTFELKRIYRQTDPTFIGLLNHVRENALTQADIALLNSRYDPNFDPPESERYIRLTTHNASADDTNSRKLAQLKTTARSYDSLVQGTFPEKSYPTVPRLTLKPGAQVMFLRNDNGGGRYYNGKLGNVVRCDQKSVIVNCGDEQGDIEVSFNTWENTTYSVDSETGEIKKNVEGTFSQIPLALAWSITIHKSQGLTFGRAIVDAGRSFSAGQVYVALSRCRTLEGLVLSSPIDSRAIITDRNVEAFVEQQRSATPGAADIANFENEHAAALVGEVFNFRQVIAQADNILSFAKRNYARQMSRAIDTYSANLAQAMQSIVTTADRFAAQCDDALRQGIMILKDETLMGRVRKGAEYFASLSAQLLEPLPAAISVDLDNQADKRRLTNYVNDLAMLLSVKRAELSSIVNQGFGISTLMRARAELLADMDKGKATAGKSAEPKAESVNAINVDLYLDLKRWRAELAKEMGKPVYTIIPNEPLLLVADAMPSSARELNMIKGIGAKTIQSYGNDILTIVSAHRAKGTEPALPLTSNAKSEDSKSAKEPKIPTKTVSLNLFRELGSVEAVANARGLKRSTIAEHLLSDVPANGLTAEQIIGKERLEKLTEALAAHPADDKHCPQNLVVSMLLTYPEFAYVMRATGKWKSADNAQ